MNKQLIATLLAILSALSGITYYMNKENTPTSLAGYISDAEIYAEWIKWTVKFGKSYSTEEIPLKYATFVNTYKFIVATNAKKLSYKLALNQFSDLSNTEFGALQKNQLILNGKWEKNFKQLSTVKLPAAVDWRDQGAVTDVKNQGQCGSCWSFSTTGGLEGLNFLKNGNLLSFSEQQLVDCSSSYQNQGCSGGLPDWAYSYTASQGIELESTYPYTAVDGTCAYSAGDVVFTNTGYADVTVNDPTQLQAAVAQQPTSVLIEADQSIFQSYSSGIINDASCYAEGQIDHAVLAIGYNQDGGQNYWIVKNSWGASWGNAGYVWIGFDPSTQDAGICGINSGPSYPN